jgi:hypothetical protein
MKKKSRKPARRTRLPKLLELPPPKELTTDDLLRQCLNRLEQVMNSDKSMGAVVSAIREMRAIAKELRKPTNTVERVTISWVDPLEDKKHANGA